MIPWPASEEYTRSRPATLTALSAGTGPLSKHPAKIACAAVEKMVLQRAADVSQNQDIEDGWQNDIMGRDKDLRGMLVRDGDGLERPAKKLHRLSAEGAHEKAADRKREDHTIKANVNQLRQTAFPKPER
jgi:hypothetical protein